jgi:hypothetical protein
MEVEDLLRFIREKTAGRKWDAETCLRVGAELAVKVNAVSNLSGSEKKKLVVDLILQVLKEAEEKEKQGKSDTTQITEKYDQLEKTVKEVLPTSLELIVSASRGKLDLKKVKPSVLMRYCSCFVKNVVTVLVAQKVISADVGKKVTDMTEQVEEKAEAVLEAVEASKEGEVVENPASVALKIREVVSTESSSQESKE